MGCCTCLKNDIFSDKEIIVNLGPKEIADFTGRNRYDYKNSPKKKSRKSSSKSVETDAESPKKSRVLGKRKKSKNLQNQRIKVIANNLRQFANDEVKNIPKYFILK